MVSRTFLDFFIPQLKQLLFFSKIHKCGSRLDRFYVNNSFLGSIVSIEHVDVLWADHKAVKCVVKTGYNPHGPGYWKCNVSVFEDKYFNDDLVALWAILEKGNKGKYDSDCWERCKSRFKSLIITHCIRLSNMRGTKIKFFLRQIAQLKELYPDDDDIRATLYDKYRNDIGDIMNFKLASVKMHNRTAQFDNQDKPTKYLLSPNLCKTERKDINCLNFEGTEYKDTGGILYVCKKYYSELLSKV
jgi:hypothetical protein